AREGQGEGRGGLTRLAPGPGVGPEAEGLVPSVGRLGEGGGGAGCPGEKSAGCSRRRGEARLARRGRGAGSPVSLAGASRQRGPPGGRCPEGQASAGGRPTLGTPLPGRVCGGPGRLRPPRGGSPT